MLMMMLMIMMMIMGLCRRSLQHPNRKTNLIKSNKKFFFSPFCRRRNLLYNLFHLDKETF